MIVIFRGLGILTVLLPAACALAVAVLGFLVNRRTSGKHTLFFIPMQYWSPILLIIGVLLMWIRPLARGWLLDI